MNRLELASRVAVVDDVIVYVAILPDGPIAVLEDVAAELWRAALADTVPKTVAALASDAKVPLEQVLSQAEDLLAALVELGFLTSR